MAVSNTYTIGTSAAAAARPDLAFATSRHLAEYGLGEESRYVSLRAFGSLEVDQTGGAISFDGAGWGFDADHANKSFQRGLMGDFGQADPVTRGTYNVRAMDYGEIVRMDVNDANVARRRRLKGDAANEQVFAAHALNMCLLGIEKRAVDVLTAATSPFTNAADVDATSNPWSTASSSIRTQLHTAMSNFDGDLDAMVVGWKAWNYLRMNTAITGTFTGARDGATISQEQARDHLAEFGIRSVYIGKSALWGDTCILYKKGSGDPDVSHVGVVSPFVQLPDGDENGLAFRVWDDPDGQKRNYLCVGTRDVIAEADGGVRITNLY